MLMQEINKMNNEKKLTYSERRVSTEKIKEIFKQENKSRETSSASASVHHHSIALTTFHHYSTSTHICLNWVRQIATQKLIRTPEHLCHHTISTRLLRSTYLYPSLWGHRAVCPTTNFFFNSFHLFTADFLVFNLVTLCLTVEAWPLVHTTLVVLVVLNMGSLWEEIWNRN